MFPSTSQTDKKRQTGFMRHWPALLCALLLAAPLCVRADSSVRFDIAAQPLRTALKVFATQANVQLLYRFETVDRAVANAVVGSFDKRAALEMLLKGTGLQAVYSADNAVTILPAGSRAPANSAPSKTGQNTTDASGALLLAAGAATEKKASADSVEEMLVEGEREHKPYTDSNIDIPRTISDPQPYYIFDAKTIERSGANNIEDFLKNRLTMNTLAQSMSQNVMEDLTAGAYGNISSVALRGLGVDKTLVLINGRRVAGPQPYQGGSTVERGTEAQPDLNGIPMSAIERIEVLPSSASGIYGGGAIGGVVNVILKQSYSGGEIATSYDNTWDADAPRRNVSLSYGSALEGGKTNFMLSAQWSDAKGLLLKDRRNLVTQGMNRILQSAPDYAITRIFFGTTPNIRSATPLVLKPAFGGMALGSQLTTIAAGTSPDLTPTQLGAMLFQNAGKWNTELPATLQHPTGLLRRLSYVPEIHSVMGTLRRQFGSRMEGFIEFSSSENASHIFSQPNTAIFNIPASSSANPFNNQVSVRFPDALAAPQSYESKTEMLAAGVKLALGHDWTGMVDFTRSRNRLTSDASYSDRTSLGMDTVRPVNPLNPFVDTLLYPLDWAKYLVPTTFISESIATTFSLRGSGPLFELPWGAPYLTVSLDHRLAETPKAYTEQSSGLDPLEYPDTYYYSNRRQTYFGREQKTTGAYAEFRLPLARRNALPLLQELELQIAGRVEKHTADGGTIGFEEFPGRPFDPFVYIGPTLNDAPYRSTDTYSTRDATAGVRYSPLRGLSLRASAATAFIPPGPDQLIKNPLNDPYSDYVTDPQSADPDEYRPVTTLSGGNPDLKPQHSESFNAGIIWEPTWSALKGLRLNAEYYRIEQFDQISVLDSQSLVNFEAFYSDRVVRDSSGAITFIDKSVLNLYKHDTAGWDLSVDYRKQTALGTFGLHAVETRILHENRQLVLELPLLKYAGYVNEGGPGKVKSNVTLDWERGRWGAGWTTTFFDSYKQIGAAGGPQAIYSGRVGSPEITAQGSDTIPSQMYHDLFVSYAISGSLFNRGSRLGALSYLDGVAVQLGVKNVLNTLPPFDARYQPFYLSPYGDLRLRSYWINVRAQF